jgi:hypothetical protein
MTDDYGHLCAFHAEQAHRGLLNGEVTNRHQNENQHQPTMNTNSTTDAAQSTNQNENALAAELVAGLAETTPFERDELANMTGKQLAFLFAGEVKRALDARADDDPNAEADAETTDGDADAEAVIAGNAAPGTPTTSARANVSAGTMADWQGRDVDPVTPRQPSDETAAVIGGLAVNARELASRDPPVGTQRAYEQAQADDE